MAMMADTRSAAIVNPGFFTRMVNRLEERFTQYAAYRKCVAELSALSDRELRDLGLHRSMLRSLAYEEAYRSMSFRVRTVLSSSLDRSKTATTSLLLPDVVAPYPRSRVRRSAKNASALSSSLGR